MKTHSYKKVYRLIVDGVICNCCGRKIDTQDEDYIEIDHEFGYLARAFNDGEEHQADVCESCYKKWVDTFKIPPSEGVGDED